MKKAILLAAALCVAATPAFANSLYFAWNNCLGDVGASSSATLDCSDFTTSSAYVTYRLDASTPNVVAVGGGIDINVESGPLPSFWQMGGGGCNESGLGIDDARANTSCTNAGGVPVFSGSGGTSTDAFILAYLPAFGGNPSRARLLWGVVRPSSSPATLAGGTTRQFACELNFFDDNAVEAGGGCVGCDAPVAMVANWVTLESPVQGSGEVVAATASSTDPGSDSVTLINGATGGVVVPTRNRTWGQIKNLYR